MAKTKIRRRRKPRFEDIDMESVYPGENLKKATWRDRLLIFMTKIFMRITRWLS